MRSFHQPFKKQPSIPGGCDQRTRVLASSITLVTLTVTNPKPAEETNKQTKPLMSGSGPSAPGRWSPALHRPLVQHLLQDDAEVVLVVDEVRGVRPELLCAIRK